MVIKRGCFRVMKLFYILIKIHKIIPQKERTLLYVIQRQWDPCTRSTPTDMQAAHVGAGGMARGREPNYETFTIM